MLSFTLRRLAAGVVLLFGVATTAFFLLYLGGGNVARQLLGDQATPEQIAQKEAELGLDRPLWNRYLDWLSSAVRGDFGSSWFTAEQVTTGVITRLPVTLSVTMLVLLLTALLATALGTLAAVKRGWLDRLVQILAIVGFAVPSYLLAVVLVTLFAIQMRIFPATGFVPITTNPALWFASIVLPAASLLVGAVASTAQQVRSAVIEVKQRDFVRTLRSRGLGENEILFRHVLRSAAPAGLTVLSVQFIYLLGGSFVIESIFALPGIGYLAVQSSIAGNLPMIMGIVVYTGAMVIIVNLIVDLANGWLNPKVRVS